MQIKKYLFHFKYFDWLLFFSAVVLICFGLAAIYSVAKSFDEPNYFNLQKQIIIGMAGIGLAVVISFFDFHFLRSYVYIFLGVAVVLLVSVLFFGRTIQGTTGWLQLFSLTFQPVELAKISLIIFLAKFFSEKFRQIPDYKFLLYSGSVSFVFFILTILQPDFGSALLLFLIWFLLIVIAGIKRSYIVLIILILAAIFLFSWFFLLKDYQKDRISVFFNPNNDPYYRGYHVRQAIIAVGSGGVLGRGLGLGSQSQLKFLPASQTDFIFAVLAEELGFLGAGLLVGFFLLFFYRLAQIAKRAPDNFSLFLVLGIMVLLFSQFFINVGMNIGLLPVTGIGLPYVSYGGSFLISCLIMVGIVESVAVRSIKYRT